MWHSYKWDIHPGENKVIDQIIEAHQEIMPG